jgi:hypothetical protein
MITPHLMGFHAGLPKGHGDAENGGPGNEGEKADRMGGKGLDFISGEEVE